MLYVTLLKHSKILRNLPPVYGWRPPSWPWKRSNQPSWEAWGHNYAKASSEQRGVATSFRWGGSVSRFSNFVPPGTPRWVCHGMGMVNIWLHVKTQKKGSEMKFGIYMDLWRVSFKVIFVPMKKILDVVSFPESCWDYPCPEPIRSRSGLPRWNPGGIPEIQPAEVGETKQAATQSDHID